jgi:hypothetical protein
MFISIILILAMIATIAGIVLYPKSEYPLNGVKTVIAGIMVLICYMFLVGTVSCMVSGRIRIGLICVFLGLAVIMLFAGIYRKKTIQPLFWRVSDVIGLLLAFVFAVGISMHVFTAGLNLQYRDATGAEQFLAAVGLLRGGAIEGMTSFSCVVEALFIGVFGTFFSGIEYYKAFVAAEIFLRILECSMFYVVVLSVSDRKVVRYAAPLLSIGYFFGYPALSMLWGNYEYWNEGALLLLFGVYALLLLEKRSDMKRYTIPLFVFSCITNLCGGQSYAAMDMVAVACAALFIVLRKWKDFHGIRKKYGYIVVLALFVVAALLNFYRAYFMELREAVVNDTVTAGIYRCMYGDLLFLLPALFFVASYLLGKKKYSGVIGIIGVCMLVETIVTYVLWYNFLLDTTWYFLNYYNLWLIGWLLAIMALEIMADTRQLPVYASYVGLIVALGTLTLTNYDKFMWEHNVSYNQLDITKNFFSLYRQSLDGLQADYSGYQLSEQTLAVFEKIAGNDDFGTTAIVTSDAAYQCWNDAFTDTVSVNYRLDQREFPDVIQSLADDEVNLIVVPKEDADYSAYQSYYENCQILFENEVAIVCTYEGTSWTDVASMERNSLTEKQELFSYVQENLANETVPLMADKTSYLDLILARNVTGLELTEFYTWQYSPVDNLNHLNECGVRYIILLNEDAYYQSTKEYFDRQEVVFENETGRILKCAGDMWSTQY